MALKKTLTMDSGASVTDAYIKVINFTGSTTSIRYTVGIFNSQADCEAGKANMEGSRHVMDYDADSTNDQLTDCYNDLKNNVDKFSGATDV